MPVKNSYTVTHRLMDGSAVVGYTVKTQDGTTKNITREQACFLVGRGSILNVKGAVSNGDIILQGEGMNLNQLPIIKVKDPKKREVATSPASAPTPKEGTTQTQIQSKRTSQPYNPDKPASTADLDKETIPTNFYTNGNRQQLTDFLIPSIINELWENLAISDKELFKAAQVGVVELDKRLGESLIVSCTGAISTQSTSNTDKIVEIGFVAALLSAEGLIPAYIGLTVSTMKTFQAVIDFCNPCSNGTTWHTPKHRLTITPETQLIEVNAKMGTTFKSKNAFKLVKWGRTTAQQLGIELNPAPTINLVEIPGYNTKYSSKEAPSKSTTDIESFKKRFESKYHNVSSQQQFENYMIYELTEELTRIQLDNDETSCKVITVMIASLFQSLNLSVVLRKDIANLALKVSDDRISVKLTGGMYGVSTVVPFEYDIVQRFSGEQSMRLKVWEPTTSLVSSGVYTLLRDITKPEDVQELLRTVEDRWNCKITSFEGI